MIGKPASRREEIFERDVKEIIDARIVNEPGRITIAEAHEDECVERQDCRKS